MPRTNTLPKEMKGNLRLFDVKITITTWETLQKTYLNMITMRKERLEDYYQKVVETYKPYWNDNYYADRDFKKVFDNNKSQSEFDIFELEDREFLGECMDIICDIQRCERYNEEFMMYEDLSDEYFEFRKTLILTNNNYDDGNKQRKMVWDSAYKAWKDANQDYIKDVRNQRSHYEFHNPYRNKVGKGCRFCEIVMMGFAEQETLNIIAEAKKRKIDEDLEKELAELDDEEEVEEVAETQSIQTDPKSILSTTKFYCENCDTTCRTKIEFIAHCETDKHKKNKFVCLTCDYRTHTKFNYDKHCNSKKHKDKI
jgi:hypothetical protein